MMPLPRRRLFALSIAAATLMAGPSFAQSAGKADAGTSLFKVVTVKDEIVIGLSGAELDQVGRDAGDIARTLVAQGTLAAWQYAVHKGANGDLEQAPLRKIGLIAHDSLRVEPYATPLKVLPHE
jgi:hypothetical protein